MTTPISRESVSRALDDARLSVFHLRAAATAGAGFFTDSYDLNVIGTVVLLVQPQFRLSSGQTSMLTSSCLLAVAAGAMVFGRLGDRLGRRRVYGLEAVLMIIGALLSALAPNFTVLVIGRLVLGLGIGGDYPASGVLMTEYANRLNRGRLVGITFIFYVFGQVSAYLISLLVLAAGVPDDLAWRLILGLGVIPSLLVLYQRRHMPESPRWTADRGHAERAMDDLTAYAGRSVPPVADTAGARASAAGSRRTRRSPLLVLLGTAGVWFFFNLAVYGNNVSQPLLIKNIDPDAGVVANTALNAILVSCFSLIGAVVGLGALDRIPRRLQQIVGLALCALSLSAIGLVPALSATTVPFVAVFGISLLGVAFGPNYTTMLLAAESFPTPIRSTFHGLSSGIAKIGAVVGATLIPWLLSEAGLRVATLVAAASFAAGIALTRLVPESHRHTLDEAGGEDLAEPLVGTRN
ncbi:MFS transporter [Amycolatopsis ultiminotia]|uniref:MFS transporter n=1 Tax=Amycolatopsis ultiminotia TaxID=543629 RepID=A0ABP6V3D1_9PSEU